MQEIVDELQKQGDKVEQVAIDGDGVTGIQLDRESMTLGFDGTNKIKVTLQRSDSSYRYYAVVEGKYYEMHFNSGVVTIDRTPSEVSNVGEKKTLTVSSSDDTVATVTFEESTGIATVTAKSKAETITINATYGSYTKSCTVTVKDIPLTTVMELNSVRARIASGYTRWLTAMTTPTDALQEFEWSSSDTSVATVDNKGVVTAKKVGTATITAKTIDGSNRQGACEVTVVENAVDVATLTDYQTANIVAKDVNGNLITVPGDFKVLTSEGTKVTDGIVIQDREGNEFVWVPVDSVSTGTNKIADDIRLGRYASFAKKNAAGNYVPRQDADNYVRTVTIGSYYQELTSNSGNTAAKNLGDFLNKTKENGGYYFGRYEAGTKNDGKIKTQANLEAITARNQPTVANWARNMYKSDYVESDLVNSYAWDTAIIFIQKYSGNCNYANKTSVNNATTGKLNTGRAEDKVCNIHDMASNCNEWTTEYCTYTSTNGSSSCVLRGGCYPSTYDNTLQRKWGMPSYSSNYNAFRPLIYLK